VFVAVELTSHKIKF